MKQRKKSVYADLPLDYFTGKPRLEILGAECLVDGLEGILEYTPQRIRLRVGKQEITFVGDALFINSFCHQGAVIEGQIITMEFSS